MIVLIEKVTAGSQLMACHQKQRGWKDKAVWPTQGAVGQTSSSLFSRQGIGRVARGKAITT
ncbi:MAG: hypothetical protein HY314_06460 [Acidobacteria bacterium]|nr:hypothetical protein [Acidobacteriota bacterium]